MGKRAGLAPGTRSGLWSHMAEAIDALQPRLVVIETCAGCCPRPPSARPQKETTMTTATLSRQTPAMQRFASWNPTRGVWETSQLELSGQPAPYSAIWPTSG